jgi:hypothetical protein
MGYLTDNIGTLTGLALAIYWHATKDSPNRKSPQQRQREAVPAILLLEGRVVEAVNLPHLRRGSACKIRFLKYGFEIYRWNVYRPDTYVRTASYITVDATAWRNRAAARVRTTIGAGRTVGHTFVGAACRLPAPAATEYVTFGLEFGTTSLIIECRGAVGAHIQQLVLPAIRQAGGVPDVQVYNR